MKDTALDEFVKRLELSVSPKEAEMGSKLRCLTDDHTDVVSQASRKPLEEKVSNLSEKVKEYESQLREVNASLAEAAASARILSSLLDKPARSKAEIQKALKDIDELDQLVAESKSLLMEFESQFNQIENEPDDEV